MALDLENQTAYDYGDYNDTVIPDLSSLTVIGVNHIIALVCYALVFIIGVPGNALVAYVTAFRMPRSVNALWFLNLALADLLCCLSLPLLMVPLAQDMHWSMGPLACKLLHGTFFLVMYWSVLQLALISLDRWMMVSHPVWCQNWRRPRYAYWACLCVVLLSLLASAPQFAIMEASSKKTDIFDFLETPDKIECNAKLSSLTGAWAITIFRCVLGFILPFLLICVSHLRVYQRASGRGQIQRGREKSVRAARVIVAVVLSFFLCWAPLHFLDILHLSLPRHKRDHKMALANVLATCLAYVNSCLNPVIYVCMGRGFKEGLVRTLRSVLHLASEAPTHSMGGTQITKSTTENTLERCV